MLSRAAYCRRLYVMTLYCCDRCGTALKLLCNPSVGARRIEVLGTNKKNTCNKPKIAVVFYVGEIQKVKAAVACLTV